MALLRSEIASKMASLRQRLEEIKEYKRILTEDGLKPDAEDKMLESELIQRLLGLEKDLARMDAAKGRNRPDDEAKAGARSKGGARSKDGVRAKDRAPVAPKGSKKGPKKKTTKGLLPGVKKDFSKVKPKSPDKGPSQRRENTPKGGKKKLTRKRPSGGASR